MRATFRQIETFLEIHRQGSFSGAAKTLGISQVAISKQMAALERAMGGEVFDRRSGSKAILNARGRVLLDKAPVLLEQARQLDHELKRDTKPTVVRVGVDNVILSTLFYPNVAVFLREHPDIQVEFVECQPVPESITELRPQGIDIAYLTLADLGASGPGTVLASSQTGLYIAPHFPGAHAWTNDSKQPIPVVLAPSGSPMERRMRASLARIGVTNYRVVAHMNHGNEMRNLAIAGIGACLLANRRAEAAVEAGELIQLNTPQHETVARYVFRNEALDNPQTDIVESYLSDLIRERADTWP